ncbi:MAG: hypothetical protein U1E27_06645, partial [Kiritimatiellia bacterium]|nr:hypothetical protein [Kiritimatiellia bacterium]
PFLWAAEHLYRMSRDCGVTVESLQESALPTPEWIARPKPKTVAAAAPADGETPPPPPQAATRHYGPYGVQIVGQADFDQLTAFLSRLEQEFPLCSISGLMMTAGRSPEAQILRITLEWPRYLGPEEDRPKFESSAPEEASP